ncbi:hypothetical protein [Stappia sp. 28M-7]|uniref:hypothetical protein n=1 Tax=Stappia sp. 28M-7 TaxID=2762596 RepID=UPI00163C3D94|nr:hypothetical protein [Stappia sp. 28M-7]MBC2859439.1 hypothetical protein [Stappia sp. 28M-7]
MTASTDRPASSRLLSAAAALALGAGLLPAAGAQAQEGWRFQITPYAWAPSLSGNIRPRPALPTASFDRPFSDILENLDGAFFLSGTARYDRFVVFGDFTWSAVSEQDRIALPFAPFGFDVHGQVRQLSATLTGGYSVVDRPEFTLDLMAGARLWYLDASVNIQAAGLAANQSDTWLDPVVAARARWQFAPDWSVIGYADFGGFGAGSQLTWQAVGTLNYRVTDNVFVSAGYRHMGLDYDRGGMRLDIDMSGPLAGVTYRF